MLKKIYFNGVILVDIPKEDANSWQTKFKIYDFIKEDINNCADPFSVRIADINSEKDIPNDWRKSFPYGRNDHKTCIEIYREEIEPALKPQEHKNQLKFEFPSDSTNNCSK